MSVKRTVSTRLLALAVGLGGVLTSGIASANAAPATARGGGHGGGHARNGASAPTGRSGRMPGLGSPLRIVRLGIRSAFIGARAGTLPPQDASQPPAPYKAALAGEVGDGVAHLFGRRTQLRQVGTGPQHIAGHRGQ